MQAMGQLFATLVSLAVIAGYRNDSFSHTGDEAKATIDSVWRWVMGAALLPTLVAIIARFNIPESPRYTMDVLGNTIHSKRLWTQETIGDKPETNKNFNP
jgi:PHS family inorganic phosphate transporter-like MFS transporter